MWCGKKIVRLNHAEIDSTCYELQGLRHAVFSVHRYTLHFLHSVKHFDSRPSVESPIKALGVGIINTEGFCLFTLSGIYSPRDKVGEERRGYAFHPTFFLSFFLFNSSTCPSPTSQLENEKLKKLKKKLSTQVITQMPHPAVFFSKKATNECE
jgi:hypothetical protein